MSADPCREAVEAAMRDARCQKTDWHTGPDGLECIHGDWDGDRDECALIGPAVRAGWDAGYRQAIEDALQVVATERVTGLVASDYDLGHGHGWADAREAARREFKRLLPSDESSYQNSTVANRPSLDSHERTGA